jgi:hypothetical protein
MAFPNPHTFLWPVPKIANKFDFFLKTCFFNEEMNFVASQPTTCLCECMRSIIIIRVVVHGIELIRLPQCWRRWEIVQYSGNRSLVDFDGDWQIEI